MFSTGKFGWHTTVETAETVKHCTHHRATCYAIYNILDYSHSWEMSLQTAPWTQTVTTSPLRWALQSTVRQNNQSQKKAVFFLTPSLWWRVNNWSQCQKRSLCNKPTLHLYTLYFIVCIQTVKEVHIITVRNKPEQTSYSIHWHVYMLIKRFPPASFIQYKVNCNN